MRASHIKITGTGCFIPKRVVKNEDFLNGTFYNEDGTSFADEPGVIIKKFKHITGISERRYVEPEMTVQTIASIAAERAIKDANIDPESLDYIIMAHNFGDVRHDSIQTDIVPSLASRVKHSLKIKNPKCVAYDIIFGCPGWVEACIQAKAFIQSGMANKCLVIGAETLSRVIDPHDRDSMIYADGAGATVLEKTNEEGGILTHESASHTFEEANYIYFGETFSPTKKENTKYIKMYGRRIYNFALTHVPNAMKECLDRAEVPIDKLKKIFIHQANEKMDEAILKRFYELYDKEIPKNIMPMTIQTLGNSSVATIPTLFHLYTKGKFEEMELEKGDVVMFASVGAGMNINAIVYQL